jgi:hypothetical protein
MIDVIIIITISLYKSILNNLLSISFFVKSIYCFIKYSINPSPKYSEVIFFWKEKCMINIIKSIIRDSI